MSRRPALGASALVAAAALTLASAAPCRGGGALYHDVAGAPLVWATQSPVTYKTDRGKLGTLVNPAATDFVSDAFRQWRRVTTATIIYQNAGLLGENVDQTNFGAYMGPFGGVVTPLGSSPIVFDEDGQIFDTIYGVGTGVLGFASPTFFSDGVTTVPLGPAPPAGSRIVEGMAFLNGKFIDGVSTGGNPEIPLAEFEAVFVHEFGHFSGLGHTQIHGLLPSAYPTPGCCNGPIETMFPFLVGSEMTTLERDDSVALSVLYPTAAFLSSTGCVEGEIRSASGDPVAGANVVAENAADPADALSAVSGENLVDLGSYRICGLTPGQSYTVRIEEIDVFHSGGSRVGPFSPPLPLPGPPEYYNGQKEGTDADNPLGFRLLTLGAGETLTLGDIVVNEQAFSVDNYDVVTSHGGPVDFATGDFDEDGRLDIMAVGPATGVTFYRNLGGGALAPPVTLSPLGFSNFGIAAGQFNAGVDSHLDVAIANYVKGNVEVYWGDGAGGFSAPIALLPSRPPAIYTALFTQGDFNGDAYRDLVLLVREPSDFSTAVSVLIGSAGGGFTLGSSNISASTGFKFTGDASIVAGQFVGSVLDDLAVGEGFANSQNLWLLRGIGASGFVPAKALFPGATEEPWHYFAAGDLDHDGQLDLAMKGEDGVRILLGDGPRNFSLATEFSVSNPEVFNTANVYGLVVDDFNGDHHPDVAAAGSYVSPGDPGARVDIALGDGAGGIASVHTVHGLGEFPSYSRSLAIEAGDFNDDGHADFVVSNKPVSLAYLAFPATISVLLEESLPECAGEETVELSDTVIVEDLTAIACDSISAGPDVEIAAGVVAAFLTGGRILVETGFKVHAGATFLATAR